MSQSPYRTAWQSEPTEPSTAALYKTPDDSSPTPVIKWSAKELQQTFKDTAQRLQDRALILREPTINGIIRKSLARISVDRSHAAICDKLAFDCLRLASGVVMWEHLPPEQLTRAKNKCCDEWLAIRPKTLKYTTEV